MEIAVATDGLPLASRSLSPSSHRQILPELLTAGKQVAAERRVFWLLFGIWIVNVFDLGFTLLAAEQHVLCELNPVVARLLPYGPGAVTLYKGALLGFGTLVIWRGRRYRISEHAAWFSAAVCVGVAAAWYKFYLDAEPIWVQVSMANKLLPDRVVMTHELGLGWP